MVQTDDKRNDKQTAGPQRNQGLAPTDAESRGPSLASSQQGAVIASCRDA
jgi:hypothetical protein